MSIAVTHHTAPTLFLGASNGIRYAYRRFGRKSVFPLIFLQHFRGNLDNWDPLLTDTTVAEREIILLDNGGVGLSSDSTPEFGGAGLSYVFFPHTESGRSLAAEFLGRFLLRSTDRDTPSTLSTREAQYDAIIEWEVPDHQKLQRLAAIWQPTLAANGSNDLMIPTRLTHLLGALIPNAEVRIYPQAHGFFRQYPPSLARTLYVKS